jgi:hypothetical protein
MSFRSLTLEVQELVLEKMESLVICIQGINRSYFAMLLFHGESGL